MQGEYIKKLIVNKSRFTCIWYYLLLNSKKIIGQKQSRGDRVYPVYSSVRNLSHLEHYDVILKVLCRQVSDSNWNFNLVINLIYFVLFIFIFKTMTVRYKLLYFVFLFFSLFNSKSWQHVCEQVLGFLNLHIEYNRERGWDIVLPRHPPYSIDHTC